MASFLTALVLYLDRERDSVFENAGRNMNYYHKIMPSIVGKLKLVASERGLVAVLWENDKPHRVRLNPLVEAAKHPILAETEQQLTEYFCGRRKVFSIKLDPVGTPFQNKVWEALKTIPFGETRSYGQIARQIGNVRAVRAVGAASGKNPISIIVPCHRVIGASGHLTGFAGGLETKERLLALECNSGAGIHPELQLASGNSSKSAQEAARSR